MLSMWSKIKLTEMFPSYIVGCIFWAFPPPKSEPCLVHEHGNSPKHIFVSCQLQHGLPSCWWPAEQLCSSDNWRHRFSVLMEQIQPSRLYIFWEQFAISSRRWSAMTDAHSSTRHISISQSCPTNMRYQTWWFLLTWFLGCRPSPTKAKARTTYIFWLPSTHTHTHYHSRLDAPLNSAK